ncbi:hypothetical protein HU200_036469 [Digitaria exilis]|uniref:DNL-type domain-containing protein n=1 Tax=Digitaria exilis TaxID=1010633 RepID=A0A835BGT5_9POAL|nr:hypothetical protein HU200_036469 [Digitaria exilis]
MATTAAAYGCSTAASLLPFAAFPGRLPYRRSSPPPRVCLFSTSKPRATGHRLRVSCRRRSLCVSLCSSGEASSDAAASPTFWYSGTNASEVLINLEARMSVTQFLCVVFQEASVDIKLPRRSLLVQFTCNACGERTQRLINRVAYERGTVFLQCAGCQVYHKFVDNLGLVVEYDLREENALQEENVVSTNSED